MGQTQQSITINTPVDRVWKAIRNFHNMNWAPNVIANIELVGDAPGDHVGAGRVLNGVFRETLLSLDDEKRTFSYSIEDGPSPVSKNDVKNYVCRVEVKPGQGTKGTVVEWSSTWEDNDEAAYQFCHGNYMTLLADMRRPWSSSVILVGSASLRRITEANHGLGTSFLFPAPLQCNGYQVSRSNITVGSLRHRG